MGKLPTRKTKMRNKMKKIWGKMRETTGKWIKIEEMLLSSSPGVKRLAMALINSALRKCSKLLKWYNNDLCCLFCVARPHFAPFFTTFQEHMLWQPWNRQDFEYKTLKVGIPQHNFAKFSCIQKQKIHDDLLCHSTWAVGWFMKNQILSVWPLHLSFCLLEW